MAKLLLIEDDPLLLGAMVPFLEEEEGHTVQVCENAREAMQALAGPEPYDLCLLDIMLPLRGFEESAPEDELDIHDPEEGLEAGIRILERVRGDERLAHRREQTLFCYSVRWVTPHVREAARALGVDGIAKGEEPERLLKAITRLTSGKG